MVLGNSLHSTPAIKAGGTSYVISPEDSKIAPVAPPVLDQAAATKSKNSKNRSKQGNMARHDKRASGNGTRKSGAPQTPRKRQASPAPQTRNKKQVGWGKSTISVVATPEAEFDDEYLSLMHGKQSPKQKQQEKKATKSSTNGRRRKKNQSVESTSKKGKYAEKKKNLDKHNKGESVRASKNKEEEQLVALGKGVKFITWQEPRADEPHPSNRRRGWEDKKCCGHACAKTMITKEDWYYGFEGNNDNWKLFLCTECCLEVEKDCVGKDLEKCTMHQPKCRGGVVKFKKGDNPGKIMKLSDFNKLELK